ncbi:MAG TPA: Rieske 2Fe-2S domain-containing protein [Bacteroidota bacterium]|nr:Rieske 2Fe-2S domain-containing protein [Bacteroidota bacterium]
MSAIEAYVRVARLSEISLGKSKRVKLGDDDVALWNVQGTIFAVNAVCAHQHFTSLHQGILIGRTVTCPMHGWQYSLETGEALSGSGRVRTYRVKIQGDEVYLERPSSA